MNETNPLEAQLRLWKPRLPSGRLERRLFPLTGGGRPAAPAWLHWFAPAMACLLFATLAVNSPDTPLPGGQPMLAVIMSNQNYAAYLPGSFQRSQNRWDTFEWTNHGHSGSSVAPFSPGRAQN